MKEIQGNIWDYHAKGHWVVITTNGSVRKDGACVMGRGVALQAKEKFPLLPYELGNEIKHRGNFLLVFPQYRIITFPVKGQWMERANMQLIQSSLGQLIEFLSNPQVKIPYPIYMVRPGCGNGGLAWKDVRPILGKYLDDRFVVVEEYLVGNHL